MEDRPEILLIDKLADPTSLTGFSATSVIHSMINLGNHMVIIVELFLYFTDRCYIFKPALLCLGQAKVK